MTTDVAIIGGGVMGLGIAFFLAKKGIDVVVLDLVRDFAQGERSALVVSHDLSLSARACDHLALLAAGRVHASGPPREVLTEDYLRETFGISADVISAPDGSPLVIPRSASHKQVV